MADDCLDSGWNIDENLNLCYFVHTEWNQDFCWGKGVFFLTAMRGKRGLVTSECAAKCKFFCVDAHFSTHPALAHYGIHKKNVFCYKYVT